MTEIAAINTALLKGLKWGWDRFGKDIVKLSSKQMIDKWKKYNYKKAEITYSIKMKELYGNIQIWRMTSPVAFDKIYTNLNILEKLSAFRRQPKDLLEDIYFGRTSYGVILDKGVDGLKAVINTDKMFILGKPGSGKTTFLKSLIINAIDGVLPLTPVYIHLRRFSETKKDLMEFIIDQFDICGFPDASRFLEAVFKSGKAIFLFDALDEVNKEDGARNRVIKNITDFCHKYNKCKQIITCRIAASEYCFEGFSYVEIADFTKDQISHFVKNWFSKDPTNSTRFLKELQLVKNDRIRDLSKNPLLLTLLCIGYGETLTFPKRRSEIYEEALDALLKKWDVSRSITRDEIYRKLSPIRKRQMFARIAAEAFENGEFLITKNRLEIKISDYMKKLPPDDYHSDVDGAIVLRSMEAQHGIFTERAKGLYSFSHLTFQEYFTTDYIVSNAHKGTIKQLVINHLSDNRWREVFMLTSEKIDDADCFFCEIIDTIRNKLRNSPGLDKLIHSVDKEVSVIQRNRETKRNATMRHILKVLSVVDISVVGAARIVADCIGTDIKLQPIVLSKILSRELSEIADKVTLKVRIKKHETKKEELSQLRLRAMNYLNKIAKDNPECIDIKNTSEFNRLEPRIQKEIRIMEEEEEQAKALTIAQQLYKKNINRGEAKPVRIEKGGYNDNIQQIKKSYNRIYEICKEAELSSVIMQLDEYRVPKPDDDFVVWDQFVNFLLNIQLRIQTLTGYTLQGQNSIKDDLVDYLYMNELFWDCLDVAYVSDRENFEKKLFQIYRALV